MRPPRPPKAHLDRLLGRAESPEEAFMLVRLAYPDVLNRGGAFATTGTDPQLLKARQQSLEGELNATGDASELLQALTALFDRLPQRLRQDSAAAWLPENLPYKCMCLQVNAGRQLEVSVAQIA